MSCNWSMLVLLVSCGLLFRPVWTVTCTDANSAKVIRMEGKYGQSLTLESEARGSVFSSRWKRFIKDQDNNDVEQTIVTYSNSQTFWNDNSSAKLYTMTFTKEGDITSYNMEINRLRCDDRGDYTSEHITPTGDCVNKYNVELTADPLPPLLRNETVRGDAGARVQVLCEGNVGFPAGEIWWYLIPADNSENPQRLPASVHLTSAGDCRVYAKSTLTFQLTKEENGSKIRCRSKGQSGLIADYAEAKIIINAVIQKDVKFGDSVSMMAEYVGEAPLLIRWSRGVHQQSGPLIVTYLRGNNSWTNSDGPRIYAALYRAQNGTISYELQISNASCDTQGGYSCHFITSTTDCVINFNITLTADPQKPVLDSEIIRADPGETVNVTCEANVGFPAGEIWWYYVPSNGSAIQQITDGITANTNSSGDCRGYVKSTLTTTLSEIDNYAKFRCRSVGNGPTYTLGYVSETQVFINGLSTNNPECTGLNCYGVQPGNSATFPAMSVSTIFVQFCYISLAVYLR